MPGDALRCVERMCVARILRLVEAGSSTNEDWTFSMPDFSGHEEVVVVSPGVTHADLHREGER